jgi:hypothetical protein
MEVWTHWSRGEKKTFEAVMISRQSIEAKTSSKKSI